MGIAAARAHGYRLREIAEHLGCDESTSLPACKKRAWHVSCTYRRCFFFVPFIRNVADHLIVLSWLPYSWRYSCEVPGRTPA